jgi:hypothetical protein
MAKIGRFEDLQSWQKGRQLANYVYDLTEHSKFAKDFRLCGQIQDAAGSIMHNIAEGFDSGTNRNYSGMSLRGGSCSPAPMFFGVPTKQSPGVGGLLRQNQERLAATCSQAE